MTTATIDTDRLKAQIDLRDLAEKVTTLKRESGRELSGPCPRCGGTDRFHVSADMAFCRTCWPLEKHPPAHDAIGFVQWLGLAADFLGACAYLDAGALPTTANRPAPATKAKPAGWESSAWQDDARRELARAQAALEGPGGQAARQYLAGRGIWRETWRAWGLGYGLAWDARLKSERAAICIPWQRDRITALKWRFLTIPDGGLRYTSKGGGACLVFGLGLAGKHGATLWAVEGELNALSLWQALRAAHAVNWDVVSFGSEGGAASDVLRKLAGKYDQVIVWADDPQATARAMAAMPGAFGLQSPTVDGVKLDANALLCAGGLADFALAAWQLYDARADKTG